MAWKQPKTDWAGKSDADGNYIGDYFNADDYNRIKNNISELRTLANSVYYPEISIQDAGADKAVGDYLYADEINVLENNLDKICQGTIPKLAGKKKSYYENTATIDFVELNRIEKCCLDLYNNIVNQRDNGRYRLSFTLGTGRRGF